MFKIEICFTLYLILYQNLKLFLSVSELHLHRGYVDIGYFLLNQQDN